MSGYINQSRAYLTIIAQLHEQESSVQPLEQFRRAPTVIKVIRIIKKSHLGAERKIIYDKEVFHLNIFCLYGTIAVGN